MQKRVTPVKVEQIDPMLDTKDVNAMSKAVEAWARANLPETFTNDDTGWQLAISFRSISKWVSRDFTRGDGIAIMHLREVVKGAVLYETTQDRSNDPHIAAVHYLAGAFTWKGKPVAVKLTIKEFTPRANEPKRLYSVTAMELGPAYISRTGETPTQATGDPTSIIVTDLVKAIRTRDAQKAAKRAEREKKQKKDEDEGHAAPTARAIKLPGRIEIAPLPGGYDGKVSDLVIDLGKLVGRDVLQKLRRKPRAAGAYFPGTAQTTIRFFNDVSVAAHEVAHALDDLYGIVAAPAAPTCR